MRKQTATRCWDVFQSSPPLQLNREMALNAPFVTTDSPAPPLMNFTEATKPIHCCDSMACSKSRMNNGELPLACANYASDFT